MFTPRSFIGFGSRLSDIPNVPTAARIDNKWAPLTEEIVYAYRLVACEAINNFTNRIADLSQLEVPKSIGFPPNPEEASSDPLADIPNELADSIRYPGNDLMMEAHPEFMWAQIEYDAPYAAAQHEGFAEMLHEHPIIPGSEGFFERTDVEHPIVVQWVAKEYSTPGTKDHYLSDPEKAMIPMMESEVGAEIRAKLGLF